MSKWPDNSIMSVEGAKIKLGYKVVVFWTASEPGTTNRRDERLFYAEVDELDVPALKQLIIPHEKQPISPDKEPK